MTCKNVAAQYLAIKACSFKIRFNFIMFSKKAYMALFVKDSLYYYMLLDCNCKFQVIVLSFFSKRKDRKLIIWTSTCFYID